MCGSLPYSVRVVSHGKKPVPSYLFSSLPLAKILGKVGESLSRICCVRPPMERFTFVGRYRRQPAPPPGPLSLPSTPARH